MLSKLIRSDGAQTLGMVPVIALVLIVAVFFVYNTGDYYYAFMREQNAIDAAVYSAAAMQSEALNMVVIINKTLFTVYMVSVMTCAGAIVSMMFTAGSTTPVACGICKSAGVILQSVEKAALMTMQMINSQASSLVFSLAAMDIYQRSGGKADIFSYKVIASRLRLEELYWDNFLQPTCYGGIPACKPVKTFMGMVEKQTDGEYDWAGGRTSKPYIYGNFNGLYDKDGPGVIGWARIRFEPKMSWFRVFGRHITVFAQARPYGGTLDTRPQEQDVSHKETRIKIVENEDGEEEKKEETHQYSRPKRKFDIPWGKADFKAKLVPVGY